MQQLETDAEDLARRHVIADNAQQVALRQLADSVSASFWHGTQLAEAGVKLEQAQVRDFAVRACVSGPPMTKVQGALWRSG